MKIRCGTLQKGYLIEITPETKEEVKLLENAEVNNGYTDGTGKIPEKKFMKYWGDTDEETKEFGKNNSGIKISLKK